MPPTLLVVPRLQTTNGGGGTMLASGGEDGGGPRTRSGWGGDMGINIDACFDTCVSQGSSRMVSSQLLLESVIRRADIGSHTAAFDNCW